MSPDLLTLDPKPLPSTFTQYPQLNRKRRRGQCRQASPHEKRAAFASAALSACPSRR